MLTLEKHSIGVGDLFAHQAGAQLRLRARQLIARDGADVVPVWNKSNRAHRFIDSKPASVLEAAEDAVESLAWSKGWHVDADHIL